MLFMYLLLFTFCICLLESILWNIFARMFIHFRLIIISIFNQFSSMWGFKKSTEKICQDLNKYFWFLSLTIFKFSNQENEHERKLRYYSEENLLTYLYDDAKTMLATLKRAARILANDPQGYGTIDLKSRKISWISYHQALQRSKHFGDGLVALGQSKKSIVGIYSENRVEYHIAEFGCYWHSIIIAPIYNTLGPDVATFIANQC